MFLFFFKKKLIFSIDYKVYFVFASFYRQNKLDFCSLLFSSHYKRELVSNNNEFFLHFKIRKMWNRTNNSFFKKQQHYSRLCYKSKIQHNTIERWDTYVRKGGGFAFYKKEEDNIIHLSFRLLIQLLPFGN